MGVTIMSMFTATLTHTVTEASVVPEKPVGGNRVRKKWIFYLLEALSIFNRNRHMKIKKPYIDFIMKNIFDRK